MSAHSTAGCLATALTLVLVSASPAAWGEGLLADADAGAALPLPASLPCEGDAGCGPARGEGSQPAADAASGPPTPDAGTEPAAHSLIVGTRETRTSGSVHVLGQQRLERFERDDAHAILKEVPGVDVREEDGLGLRPNIGMRGASPDRSKKVTLLEDGVPFAPAPYSASAAYYFPLVTRATAVRVMKGPSAIIHGPHTVGGSVELITRDVPTGPTFGLDLAAGQYGYGKLHGFAGAGTERTRFLVEGAHLRSTGFHVLDGGGDTGFVRNDWMVKLAHRPELLGTRHDLQLKLGYGDEASNETYLGLTEADARATPSRRYLASQQDHMLWRHTQLALTHRYRGERLSWTSTLYRNDLDRTWRKFNAFAGADVQRVLANPDSARNQLFLRNLTGEASASTPEETLLIGPNHRTFVSQGAQTALRYEGVTGPARHAVEVGARLHYDSVRRDHQQDGFRMTEGVLLPDGRPTQRTALNRASTTALALHAIDAVGLGPVTVTPGARLELLHSRYLDTLAGAAPVEDDHAIFIPGLGVHWQALEPLGVFAGANRGFSPAAPGPTRSAPESSWNYEGGARLTHARSRLEVVGFFNDYQNLTSVCTLSSGCIEERLDQQLSAGQARVYGAEVYGEHRFRLPAGLKVPLGVAYTYTQSALLTAFDSSEWGRVEVGDELPYSPEHQVTVSAGVDHDRGALHLQASWTDPMREEPGQSTDELFTDAHLAVDASLHLRLTDWAELYLNVRNLLDERAIVARKPYGARTNAPRWLQLGLRLSL